MKVWEVWIRHCSEEKTKHLKGNENRESAIEAPNHNCSSRNWTFSLLLSVGELLLFWIPLSLWWINNMSPFNWVMSKKKWNTNQIRSSEVHISKPNVFCMANITAAPGFQCICWVEMRKNYQQCPFDQKQRDLQATSIRLQCESK